ncbi:hypothetical protein AAFF_G00181880 [Aldrovandia affinis]|uniref:Uncharacterized protein n=1 Tax=Aldrovandia affinis TaxID=143900 RepID=A0AAD7RKJ2_9TELE|nr:hypothetical protein AAFF_G00181880 [Aldrovandia affinis]
MWRHSPPPRGSPLASPRCTGRVSGVKGSGRLTCHFGSGLCQRTAGAAHRLSDGSMTPVAAMFRICSSAAWCLARAS